MNELMHPEMTFLLALMIICIVAWTAIAGWLLCEAFKAWLLRRWGK